FGTNNCDHQARICHSTTVAGVANTWGYGAMTNSYNDMQNSKCAMYIGSNAAEAHPVSLLHMLHAKETGCKMIVVDPRFTRTAAKADEYVRIRSGSDIAFLFGMLHHIFKNNWEDKQYIHDRVYGMDKVKEDVMAKWTPDKVEEVCGVPEARVYQIAEMMAKNRPSTVVWCMGQTQHTIGNALVRASCIFQLALDRPRAGDARADRPGQQPARGRLLGARAEQPDAWQGNDRGDEKARHAGRHRSVSVGDGGDGGDGAQGRRLPAARVHAVRDFRLGHCVEPLAAMARARHHTDVRVADRSGDHVPVRQEVRLRQGIGQDSGNLAARRQRQV